MFRIVPNHSELIHIAALNGRSQPVALVIARCLAGVARSAIDRRYFIFGGIDAARQIPSQTTGRWMQLKAKK